MRFGSLFTGIGGIDLGFEAAGMECAWQVEWDDYCQKVLARHWPDIPRFGEIRSCGKHNLEPVDLICGGFPCQPVSVAGRRDGVADGRWLWPEFHRIICELRPRWVVAENVAGLLSANSGGAMGEVLGDLAACGYDAVWDVFPAGGQGGVGAPHRRERIFIVAHANSGRPPRQRQRDSGGVGKAGGREEEGGGEPSVRAAARSPEVAHTNDIGSQKRHPEHGEPASEGETDYVMPRGSVVPNPDSAQFKGGGVSGGIHQKHPDISDSRGWAVEPDVGRMADGVPSRVDRLKCLGNAVVPQVAEGVGRMIMKVANA